MLFNAQGEVVLVRHSYGRSDLFALPGGGVRPFETFETAARREMREELGIVIAETVLLSTHFSAVEGKRDTIALFKATANGEDKPHADGFELEEARFFPLDALPLNTSPATLRRIAEYRGEGEADPAW